MTFIFIHYIFYRMINKGNNRLKIIGQRNLENLSYMNRRLYPLFYCKDLWISAYEKLKSNKVPGVGKSSLEGFSIEKIDGLIQLFREEKWNPKPVHRIFIPKTGKKIQRALGIQGPEEIIVQEIVRRILEAIYEPVFLDVSHGFRPNKSCHSALSEVERKFQGIFWIIEGDITGCYDNIPHPFLIKILRKRICDERFLNLIWKLLRAGYLDSDVGIAKQWQMFVPREAMDRSLISPLLANIYLNELDHWVVAFRNQLSRDCLTPFRPEGRKQEMKSLRLRRGQIKRSLKTVDGQNRFQLVRHQKDLKNKFLTASLQYDYSSKSKKIQYVRYADNWILGIYGPKSMAVEIKNRLSNFILRELGLELNAEKTQITDVRKKCILFLGYYIKIAANRKILRMQSPNRKVFLKRTTGQLVKMLFPMNKVIYRLYQKGFCDKVGYPLSQKKWSNQDDVGIVRSFRSILYGITNYYSGASYQHPLGRIDYILRYSCAKTLAHKHNSSCNKIFKKYGKELSILNTSVSLKKIQYTNKRKRWQNSSKIQDPFGLHLGRITRSGL